MLDYFSQNKKKIAISSIPKDTKIYKYRAINNCPIT